MRGYLYLDDEEFVPVTVDPLVKPVLEDKIIRQNGTYTPTAGYDGMGSVDVGIGQVGSTILAENKTGANIEKDSKLWLNYRQVGIENSLLNQTVYTNGGSKFYNFFVNDSESTLYYNTSSSASVKVDLTTLTKLNSGVITNLSVSSAYNTKQYENGLIRYGYSNSRYGDLYCYTLDVNAATITKESGRFTDITGFYNGCDSYNSGYSTTKSPDGSVTLSTYGPAPLYGFTKDGTSYLCANTGYYYRIYTIDPNTYALTQYAYMGYHNDSNYVGLPYNITRDKKYLIINEGIDTSYSSSSKPHFGIYSVEGKAYVNTTVLPNSIASMTENSFKSFDNRTGIMLAVPYSQNTMNLKDIKIARYNKDTELFEDITLTVGLPSTTIPTNGTSSYTLQMWLNSKLTTFVIRMNTTLHIFQLKEDSGWVITTYEMTNDSSIVGYAKDAIIAGETRECVVGTAGVTVPYTITPTTSTQIIDTHDTSGYNPITVNAVTSSIDNNILPQNIKYGVSILGVAGTYDAPTRKYQLLERIIDDNDDEIGTVCGFFTDSNDIEYAVVCLDAQYRLAEGQVISTADTITDIPEYSNMVSSSIWNAKETATFNTQKILDYCTLNEYTSSACTHCRNQSFIINGVTYSGQLPNELELFEIVKNFSSIENLDISAVNYPDLNFSTARNIFSSSQNSSSNCWVLSSQAGGLYTGVKTGTKFICPVLELPNTL